MNAPDLKSLCPGAEAKPDPIKGGLRVTSFFTYNCLAVSVSETLAIQKKCLDLEFPPTCINSF